MSFYIKIAAFLSRSIESRTAGRTILQNLVEKAPNYQPERFGDCEPIRKRFVPSNLAPTLDVWHEGLYWKRRAGKLDGTASTGQAGVHPSISLDVLFPGFDLDQTLSLLKALDEHFTVELAYMSGTTGADVAPSRSFGIVTTHELRQGLPGMAWGMWFGRQYQTLFGDQLKTVPAYAVRTIGNGIYVQLTESIADISERRDEYLAAQSAAEEHLGLDAFQIGDTVASRVPEFVTPIPLPANYKPKPKIPAGTNLLEEPELFFELFGSYPPGYEGTDK